MRPDTVTSPRRRNRRSRGPRDPRGAALRCRPAALAVLVVAAACTTPHARTQSAHAGTSRNAGDTFAQARAWYGVPILQKSLFWDGNGEDDTAGVSGHVAHYVAQDLAIGAGLNCGNWFLPGADARSAEIEGLLRYHPLEGLPLFWDLHGGYQHSTEPVPCGGTEWNFSFGFGPGVDLALDDGCSLLFGVDYHHVSNALGRMNDRNPSQNEARFWLGVGWTL